MNIFKRMACITNELGYVSKNLNVDTGSYKKSYKAVSEVDILKAVRPLEEKYGVYSYPCKREIIDSGTFETPKSKRLFLRMHVQYKFINIDNPNEYIIIDSFGDGLDSGDKATGKAMTYADKYALMKAYKIRTGDDPDEQYQDTNEEQYKESVDEQLIITATQLQSQLALVGCDVHDEKVSAHIMSKTKLQTLDIGKLNNRELKILTRYYAGMLKAANERNTNNG